VKRKTLITCLSIIIFLAGCLIPGQQSPKIDPEHELLLQIMTAFENRAYESSIEMCQQFLSQYPKSTFKDMILMRMGESFEGLLKQEYQKLLEEGMEEAKARSRFLEKYDHYNCWEVKEGRLVYNKAIYRQLLKENPNSNYADEASYNLIPWEKEYYEDPYRIEKEIVYLEEILKKYPTTSLRPKILFQMGYRFHLLYELYNFTNDPEKRDERKAQESFRKAEYLYKLCLSLPRGSEYSKKALHYLEMLKKGSRIYLNPSS
jgi:outer membrane protein assembly factor BamD (BamD/ComL family)